MINKILVPIDGSTHARTALDLASEIAVKYDATLLLLHAIPDDIELSEPQRHFVQVGLRVYRHVGAFGEVLSEQTVGRTASDKPNSGKILYGAWAVRAETVIDLGSVMQASRHWAQPTQMSGSMVGRKPSCHWRAPGTGQLSAQAPHSGPE